MRLRREHASLTNGETTAFSTFKGTPSREEHKTVFGEVRDMMHGLMGIPVYKVRDNKTSDIQHSCQYNRLCEVHTFPIFKRPENFCC